MKREVLTFKMSHASLKVARWARHSISLFQRRGVTGLLMLLLSGVASLYLFANARKLLEFEWQLHPGWLAIAIVLVVFIAPLIRVWLWQLVLTKLGVAISLSECFRIVRLSQLAKYLPGQAWHYVGTFFLTHKAGATKEVALSGMLYDQGASFVAGALVVIFYTLLSSFLDAYMAIWLVTGVNLLIGVVFLYPALFSKLTGLILRVFKKPPVPLLPTLPVGSIGVLIFLNIGFWLVFGSSLFFLVRGVAYPGIPLFHAIVIGSLGVMAGFIAPFAPSGIGVTEGMLVLLLQRYFPTEISLAISLLFRVLNISKEILLGLVAVKVERRESINCDVAPIEV